MSRERVRQRACVAESENARARMQRAYVAQSVRVTHAASSPPFASASVMHLHSWAATLHEASNVHDDASRSFGVALVAGV